LEPGIAYAAFYLLSLLRGGPAVGQIVLVLFSLAFVLTLVALIGHGLWLAAAAVLKPLFDPWPPDPPRPGVSRLPGRCAGCGTALLPQKVECPQCGLDPEGPTAAQLRDLEVATRCLQSLRENEALDAATCERVYQSIEARQRELIDRTGATLTRPDAVAVD